MKTCLKATLACAFVLMLSATAQAQCLFDNDAGSQTMTLLGDCVTTETIFIPDGWILDGAGFTIEAMNPGSGSFLGAVVQNAGTTAHVKNLTIEGVGLSGCQGAGPPDNRLRGILFNGANGSILDNRVVNINRGPGNGCQEGNGIEVRNAPFDGTHPDTKTVTISGNEVLDYQKTGIVANGDVAVTVTDNDVTGFGPIVNIGQNGIQLGFGATGIVMRNRVTGNFFTGTDWTAVGILLFEANDIMVQMNDVRNNQLGIGIETWCWFAPTASENRLVMNEVHDSRFGARISAFVIPDVTGCDPSADNNKVVNNTLVGAAGDGDTGVAIFAFNFGGPQTPSAVNNKLIGNRISGFTTSILEFGSSESKVQANVAAP